MTIELSQRMKSVIIMEQINAREEKAMQQVAMNLREFMDRFKTENDCRDHFFKLRWPEGFKWPKCGHIEFIRTEENR